MTTPCPAIDRSNPWRRSRAIIAGHSPACACAPPDPACPIATGKPLARGRLGAAVAALHGPMRPATELQGAREVPSGERVAWDYEPRPMGYQRNGAKP